MTNSVAPVRAFPLSPSLHLILYALVTNFLRLCDLYFFRFLYGDIVCNYLKSQVTSVQPDLSTEALSDWIEHASSNGKK